MADSQDGVAEPEGFGVLAIIMLSIIMMIFLVVVFIFFLYLYAKWYRRHSEQTTTGSSRRRRMVFPTGQDPRGQRRELDPEILRSLPVLIFQQEEFKDGLECTVCLSELVQGEKARLLPKCNHGFHVDCIDMWFQSHSTCPICRKPVASESLIKCSSNSDIEENASENYSQSSNSDVGSSMSPIYGNQTQACSMGSTSEEKRPSLQPPCSSSPTSSSACTSGKRDHGMLMIDIPSEINPSFSLPSSSRFAEDELISPVITSLKSFKRLLSWNKRSGPSSPGAVDVEQAGKGEN